MIYENSKTHTNKKDTDSVPFLLVGNTGFEPVAFRTSSGYSPAELIAQTI